MKFNVTYTRILTLKEEVEAETREECERLASIRYGQLDNNEFELEGEIELDDIPTHRLVRQFYFPASLKENQ